MSRKSRARRRDRREQARWESDLFTAVLPARQGKPLDDPDQAAALHSLTRGLPTGIPRSKPIEDYTEAEKALLEEHVKKYRPMNTYYVVGSSTDGTDAPNSDDLCGPTFPQLEIPGEILEDE